MTQLEFNAALLHCLQRLAKEIRRATLDLNPEYQVILIDTQQQLQDLETQLPTA